MNIRKRIKMRRLAARKAAEAAVVVEAPVVVEAVEAQVAVEAPKFSKKNKYKKAKVQVVEAVVEEDEEASEAEPDSSEE